MAMQGDEKAATTLMLGHDGNENDDFDKSQQALHLKREWKTGKGGEFQ